MWGEQGAHPLMVATDRDSLVAAMEGADALMLLLFKGHLQRLLRNGIPAECLILHLIHTRIGLALPDLNRLHAVLALNGQEKALLRIAGMESQRLH